VIVRAIAAVCVRAIPVRFSHQPWTNMPHANRSSCFGCDVRLRHLRPPTHRDPTDRRREGRQRAFTSPIYSRLGAAELSEGSAEATPSRAGSFDLDYSQVSWRAPLQLITRCDTTQDFRAHCNNDGLKCRCQRRVVQHSRPALQQHCGHTYDFIGPSRCKRQLARVHLAPSS
jgi:hypothetical protein